MLISGGGRCNVTNNTHRVEELVKNYPRGGKELVQVFSRFNVNDCIAWFESHGVTLKTESDGRMFPVTDSSQTIVDCFMRLTNKLGIEIVTQAEVFSIKKDELFTLNTARGTITADAIICASGGHPKAGSYSYIQQLGHTIDAPIPSLFTINLPGHSISKLLQGLSVEQAEVSVAGSKLKYTGPVLITHWGLSGPAVLKLSAFAAKELHASNYQCVITVNWVYPLNEKETEAALLQMKQQKGKALPWTNPGFKLPRRLWEYLCNSAGIDNSKPWAEIGKPALQNLTKLLFKSDFTMHGKTTFKEEFVTCGGVNLKEVDFKTMQSKKVPGLFFCGEVLNIDGITGGFNFQSAWSTAWICAQNV